MNVRPGPKRSMWPHPTRTQKLAWLLVVLVMLVVILRDYDSHPAILIDSSRYVVLAQSLLQSPTYGLINGVGAPGQAQYPFGYPFVLAPVVALFPGNFEALRVPSTLATLLNAALLFWGWPLLSRRSYWWGLVITALCCLSPITVLQARLVLSEAVFLTWLLLVILLAEWGAHRSPAWWWFLAQGTAATMMVFTRTVGWVMWAGIVIYWLYRKRTHAFGELLLLAAVMVGVTALIVTVTAVAPADVVPNAYARQSSVLIRGERVVSGSEPEPYSAFLKRTLPRRVSQDLPAAVIPALNSNYVGTLARQWGIWPLLLSLGVLTTLIMALGLVRWWVRDGPSAFLLAALPYLGLLMAWTWTDRRFLYPIQAQMFYAFLIGLEGCGFGLVRFSRRPQTRRFLKPALMAVIALMLALFAAVSLAYPDNRVYSRMQHERGQWFRQHTQVTDVIMSSRPQIDYLFTGHRTVDLTDALDFHAPEEFASYLEQQHVRYLIAESERETWALDPTSGLPARELIDRGQAHTTLDLVLALAAQGRLALVYTGEQEAFQVFAVVPSAPGD